MSHVLDELIYEVRVCYQSLLQVGEALHADTGISMGQRAVMEYLLKYGSSTVPTIASERRVSRQRIQTLVNQLLECSLVKVSENPATKRSPLVSLTEKGEKVIVALKQKEEELIQGCNISDGKSREAIITLRKLREALEGNAIDT